MISFNFSTEVRSEILERIILRIIRLHYYLIFTPEKVQKETLRWFRRLDRMDVSRLTPHISERRWWKREER